MPKRTVPKMQIKFYASKNEFVLLNFKDMLAERVCPWKHNLDIIFVYNMEHTASSSLTHTGIDCTSDDIENNYHDYQHVLSMAMAHDNSGIRRYATKYFVRIGIYDDDPLVHAYNMLKNFYASDCYKEAWNVRHEAEDLTQRRDEYLSKASAIDKKLSKYGVKPKTQPFTGENSDANSPINGQSDNI